MLPLRHYIISREPPLPYSTPLWNRFGAVSGAVLQAQEGDFYFTELAERVEYGNDDYFEGTARETSDLVRDIINLSYNNTISQHNTCMYIYIYISLSLFIYIYIDTHTHTYTYLPTYLPTYHTSRERQRRAGMTRYWRQFHTLHAPWWWNPRENLRICRSYFHGDPRGSGAPRISSVMGWPGTEMSMSWREHMSILVILCSIIFLLYAMFVCCLFWSIYVN